MSNEPPPTARVRMLSLEDATETAAKVGMRPELAKISFYRVLLNSPQAGRVESEINDRILWEGRLTVRPEATRLRELAIMRLAWVTRCAYQWAHHFSPTVDVDLPGKRPADVLGVREGEHYAGFGAPERAVMRAVDEMVRDGRIAPVTIEQLKELLDNEGEVVELCYVIAIWRAIISLMHTFEPPLEDGYEPWAPDGVAPPADPLA